jgi:hypothetical protein
LHCCQYIKNTDVYAIGHSYARQKKAGPPMCKPTILLTIMTVQGVGHDEITE